MVSARFDADSLMVESDVVEGRDLEALVERLFTDLRAMYLQVHFARPGCSACRIDRS